MNIMMKKHELEDMFPYKSIALRIFLCTPATNCTVERPFSIHLRVPTGILNIEYQLTNQINYTDIIKDFTNNQARKKLH